MSINQHYKIRNKQVINETLDNETIIINLETGVYYSINLTGTIIWKAIDSGFNINTITDKFLVKFENQASENIQELITRFVNFIESELLIEKAETATLDSASFDKFLAGITSDFITPTIEKYQDMQDMLLADPIHEVENDGWPILKKG
jgi:hypothetical protein